MLMPILLCAKCEYFLCIYLHYDALLFIYFYVFSSVRHIHINNDMMKKKTYRKHIKINDIIQFNHHFFHSRFTAVTSNNIMERSTSQYCNPLMPNCQCCFVCVCVQLWMMCSYSFKSGDRSWSKKWMILNFNCKNRTLEHRKRRKLIGI